jgi:GDP-L-fucose synthase
MDLNQPIYVAGHRGMVGAAIVRALRTAGADNLLLRDSSQLDLRDPATTHTFFKEYRPAYVFMAAARVGGIRYNAAAPYDFLRDNFLIAANVTESARLSGVCKMLFLGSSCIYPRLAPQPIREDALLTGPLEPTNEAYAIAKIAGIRLCDYARRQHACDFISAMPCNLYGPGDNFSLENSHVLPAMIRKMYEAKLRGDARLVLWGTGKPLREFLHADDLAEACLFLMHRYSKEGHINVGSGDEVSIAGLASLVAETVGYKGRIEFDPSHPDGTPRKLMDSSAIRALGWSPRIRLVDGIRAAHEWFLREQTSARR